MCFQSPLGLRQMICIKRRARCLVVPSIIPSTCKAKEECGHPCHEHCCPGTLCGANLITKHPPETPSPFTWWCVVPFVPGWQEVTSYATKGGGGGGGIYIIIWHCHTEPIKGLCSPVYNSYNKLGIYRVILSLLYPSGYQQGTSLETSWNESLHLHYHVW